MRHREAGFTLLEVLVAFTIFSIVLVAIYGSLSTSLRGEAEAHSVLSTSQVARTVMSEVGLSIPLTESNPSGQEADGTKWSLRISREGVAAEGQVSGQLLQLFRLDLTVWDSSDGEFHFRRTMLGRING